MFRVLIGIIVVSMLIAASSGSFATLVFPFVLVGGLVFGIPLFLIFRDLGWLSWWHAALAGILCAVALMVLVLPSPPSRRLLDLLYAVTMGGFGGVVLWIIAIFRNPMYPEQRSFPKSIIMILPITALLFGYKIELQPESFHGCVVGYVAAENPTSWEYAYAEVEAGDGNILQIPLTKGSSNPEIIGGCASYSRTKNASLTGFNYIVHSTRSNGECSPPCLSQADA
jgi:hypothetical protein|tara:strand:- start:261 stop:938 length:678 start_codon:yes stop_codon:yes gene_type:complete